jgi:hypothetical protein
MLQLVGMTANCWPTFHVQSMIWATDLVGMEILLFPPQSALDYLAEHPVTYLQSSESENKQLPGINGCFHNWDSAVRAEISSTSLIWAAGYKVDAMMAAYQGQESYRTGKSCSGNSDVLWDGKYWGTNMGFYETLFMKSNRNVDPTGLKMQTEWMSGREYRSYDHCKL